MPSGGIVYGNGTWTWGVGYFTYSLSCNKSVSREDVYLRNVFKQLWCGHLALVRSINVHLSPDINLMSSKKIRHTSDLYIEKKNRFHLRSSSNQSWRRDGEFKLIHSRLCLRITASQLNPVEYGMGFDRGELNAFVNSRANEFICEQ